VIRSVTKNGRSILLTAVLAFILIYLFSIVGFVFFRDDFMIEVDALDTVGINKGNYIQQLQFIHYLYNVASVCCYLAHLAKVAERAIYFNIL